MKQSVRDAFVKFTATYEGVVPWLYLDVKGLVTVGIGNLVDPIEYAVGLPFVRTDGSPATDAEIREAWRVVKAHQELAQQGYRVAARYSTVRLTDDGIAELVMRKLEANDRSLVRRFPSFEAWPADAQLATHSMSWACGPAFYFPRLEAALRIMDFEEAAKECTINEAGNAGVVPRNKANRILYRNAGKVCAWKLDPDELQWPHELLEVPPEPLTVRDVSIIHPKLQFDPRQVDTEDDDPPPEAA